MVVDPKNFFKASVLIVAALVFAGCSPRDVAKKNSGDSVESGALDDSKDRVTDQKTTAIGTETSGNSSDPKSSKIPMPETSDADSPNTAENFNPLRILGWNVESDGNDPIVIAEQLKRFDDYHIYALCEAGRNDVMPYADALGHSAGKMFYHFGSNTGRDDRLAFIFDSERLDLIQSSELFIHGEFRLNDWRHRSPLVGHFRDKETGTEFLVIVNHLARGNADLRTEQAEGLRNWAAEQKLPVIAVGDYNLDFEFSTEKGNAAFDEFVKDDTWTWVKPKEMIDTNWADRNGDGVDDYPGSMLDFAFVAGAAKNWHPQARVITRRDDFPDNARTSDHRPVELIVEIQ